jgi:EAL domain-containing protein (putative c-di-GMP-specific phosphodiesterase class I)
MIMLSDFIKLVQVFGLDHPITQLVIETVQKQCRDLQPY